MRADNRGCIPMYIADHYVDMVYKGVGDKKAMPKRLKDVSIYRQDSKGYADRPFDIRIFSSPEYKIKIHNDTLRDEITALLTSFDWNGFVQSKATKSLQHFHIIQVLKDNVSGIT